MKENRYSIKDIEHLTHIKAHTIRIWEQRYQILVPKRTSTNIRYYDDDDLRKILNVNSLYQQGVKISKIADLSESELIQEVQRLQGQSKVKSYDLVQSLIQHVMQLNEAEIMSILESKFSAVGLEELYEKVLVPSFIRIGELWQINTLSIGHEHFFSTIVRNYIIGKIQTLPLNQGSSKRAVLFLHTHEEHEISLMIYHYMLRSNGYHCVFLGQNTPFNDVRIVCEQFKPQLILSNFVKQIDQENFEEIIYELIQLEAGNGVAIGGAQALQYKSVLPKGVQVIQSRQDLEQIFV